MDNRAPSVHGDPSGREGPDAESALLSALQLYLDSRRRHCDVDRSVVDAWENFHHDWEEVVDRLIRGVLRSESDRLDCIQEVWVVILTRLPHFRIDHQRGHFRDWLTAVTRHALADYLRRHGNHAHEYLGAFDWDGLPGREPDPSTLYERQCVRSAVRSALVALQGQVSPTSYQAFHLWLIEGRSVREIAACLHMTPKRVRDRLARVRTRCRVLVARERVSG